MSTSAPRTTRVALVGACCLVLLGGAVGGGIAAVATPATAAGTQSSTENANATGVPSGPFTTVAVAPNETVAGDVTASGGRVVVAGTVEGDLRAYGGVVVLTEGAVVTGDAQAFGGRVLLAGEVRGPVTAYGGTVEVAGTGSVGDVNAGGETVTIAGETGDATVLGATAVLAEGATVGGDFEYDARLRDRGGTVAGERRPTDALLGPAGVAIRLAGWLPVLLPLLGGLLGVALARVDPRTETLAAGVADAPARTLGRGVGVALASMLGVVLVAATVVGLPLLGLLVPLLLAGVLLSLAVGTLAVGRAVAGRFSTNRVSTASATLLVAIAAAALGLLHVLGSVGILSLALLGTGTAPRVRSR
ncbi:bactofilin family protein [Halorarum halobium]|uniref:bactofilin family protein n=1 Tax=Halorarum halobium TaxID=3075121 RepID=UPI0028B025D2|nr:polymer-forming cytoskeletal protein [Halobaculum sp. XH14]